MHNHLVTTPSLATEVPGCAQEQLDRLARSIEARRQQLEEDINAYIARKQDELRRYESEVGKPNRFRALDPHSSARTFADPASTLPGSWTWTWAWTRLD